MPNSRYFKLLGPVESVVGPTFAWALAAQFLMAPRMLPLDSLAMALRGELGIVLGTWFSRGSGRPVDQPAGGFGEGVGCLPRMPGVAGNPLADPAGPFHEDLASGFPLSTRPTKGFIA